MKPTDSLLPLADHFMPAPTMWPAPGTDERLRFEQELLMNTQGRAYSGGAGVGSLGPSAANPASLQAQLSRGHQLAMHQHINTNAQATSAFLFPSHMGTDATVFHQPHGMMNGMSTAASSPISASSRIELWGLLRLREEREQLDRHHAMNQQLIEAQQQEINKLRSTETANNHFQPSSIDGQTQVNKGDPSTANVKSTATSFSPRRKESAPKEKKSQASNPTPKAQKLAPSEKARKSEKKDSKWLATLEELKKYKRENGNTIVPRGYSQNPRLASWVAEQRKQYKLLQDKKQSSITQERVDLLNGIDFAWNAQEAAWSRHVDDLRRFRADTGHCHVPLNHPTYPKLGLWVKEQRRHYTLMKQGKPSHMTAERCKELNSLEFCYDTHESTWLERLRELANFNEENGSCIVPSNHYNPKLATWVHHQRRQYRKFKLGQPCHITEERIGALDKLGFIWYPRQSSSDPDDDSSTEDELGDSDDESRITDNNDEKRSSATVDDNDEKRSSATGDFRPSKRHRHV